MSENCPAPGSEAANLASALRAQADLSRDPAVAESLRRSAAQMEEADAKLQEGLASLEQAIAQARALAEDPGSENALPRWVVVALILVAVFVFLLSLVRGVHGGVPHAASPLESPSQIQHDQAIYPPKKTQPARPVLA
jgi:hypothetical protein